MTTLLLNTFLISKDKETHYQFSSVFETYDAISALNFKKALLVPTHDNPVYTE